MIEMASKGHLEGTAQEDRTESLATHVLFDTDTAPDAKELGDERDLVGGLHLDTEFTCMTITHLARSLCDE